MNGVRNTRREFLAGAGAISSVFLGGCERSPGPSGAASGTAAPSGPADVTLRIGTVLADIAKEHTISTQGYNGSVPGPLVRLHEGVAVTVDLFNDTDTSELVHWHGQIIPAAVDGAAEEKSLSVPAHGHLRYQLTPQPAGARFVHTHVMAMSDVNRGTYTGQFAFSTLSRRTTPAATIRRSFSPLMNSNPFPGPRRWKKRPATRVRPRSTRRERRGSSKGRPMAGKSDISVLRSTGSASGTVSRFASKKASVCCFTFLTRAPRRIFSWPCRDTSFKSSPWTATPCPGRKWSTCWNSEQLSEFRLSLK
jgi:Multicopper oxidase